jgi:hypothetical protein
MRFGEQGGRPGAADPSRRQLDLLRFTRLDRVRAS